MSRARDVADVQDNAGGAVPPFVAGKNAVINGGFDIWQRGTSNTFTVGPAYTADRFSFNCSAVTSVTISQITTSDTTNLPNIYNAMRIQRTAANTSVPLILIQNSIESKDSYRFAGQTVTFSFWARKGATFSPTSFTAQVISGTGTDQSLVSGFTGSSGFISSSITLTTSWQRFTATGTVSSSATQLGFQFFWTPVGTAGASDYVDITGVQLELGSVATPFARAGGTIQGELAACQRYYWRSTGGGAYSPYGNGGTISTTGAYISVQHPVQMRVTPTSIDFSNIAVQTSGGTLAGLSALTVDQTSLLNSSLAAITGSTWTANQPCRILNNNNTAGYIGLNAEL